MVDTVDNDVIAVTVIHDNDDSGEQINRYQFQKTDGGAISDADLLDDCSDIVQFLYTILVAAINARNYLREVGVFNITQNRIIGTTDGGTYVGGTGVDPALPQGVAGYIYFKTAIPKVILSKYLPSSQNNRMVNDGTWTSPQITAYTAYAALLMEPWSLGDHQYEYGYLSPKTMAFEVPDLAVVPTVPAYMRKRKPGRGA